ncbi:MAG TPA: N-acetylmuramoyl-L-alanine amidase, partial [Myxococcota bacterium]|nr:N-acetylmuramoyl-L-alanine amidase [Myxococcota bacterium]
WNQPVRYPERIRELWKHDYLPAFNFYYDQRPFGASDVRMKKFGTRKKAGLDALGRVGWGVARARGREYKVRTVYWTPAAQKEALARLRSKVRMFVLHHDVTYSSLTCYQVLCSKPASVHFMIDYDGTVYQTVDLVHSTGHADRVNGDSVGVEINMCDNWTLLDLTVGGLPVSKDVPRSGEGLRKYLAKHARIEKLSADRTAYRIPCKRFNLSGEYPMPVPCEFDGFVAGRWERWDYDARTQALFDARKAAEKQNEEIETTNAHWDAFKNRNDKIATENAAIAEWNAAHFGARRDSIVTTAPKPPKLAAFDGSAPDGPPTEDDAAMPGYDALDTDPEEPPSGGAASGGEDLEALRRRSDEIAGRNEYVRGRNAGVEAANADVDRENDEVRKRNKARKKLGARSEAMEPLRYLEYVDEHLALVPVPALPPARERFIEEGTSGLCFMPDYSEAQHASLLALARALASCPDLGIGARLLGGSEHMKTRFPIVSKPVRSVADFDAVVDKWQGVTSHASLAHGSRWDPGPAVRWEVLDAVLRGEPIPASILDAAPRAGTRYHGVLDALELDPADAGDSPDALRKKAKGLRPADAPGTPAEVKTERLEGTVESTVSTLSAKYRLKVLWLLKYIDVHPGKINPKLDAAAKTAVSAFQAKVPLPATGELDKTTRDALRDAYTREVERYLETLDEA